MFVAPDMVGRGERKRARCVVPYTIRGGSDDVWGNVRDGFTMWEDANPWLKFVGRSKAPLVVLVRRFRGPNAGCATMGTWPRGVIRIDPCLGSARVVAHEIGHIMGFGHHDSGLMFHGHHIMDHDDREHYETPDMGRARRFRLPDV